MIATIFKDVFSKEAHYLTINLALRRIKEGASKGIIAKVRSEVDDERRNSVKKALPCVLFSGKFTSREDGSLLQHSGFVILDFDYVEPTETKADLADIPWIYAAWVSPSGEGVKALVRIKDPSLHRQHLKAIFKELPKADPVNINLARVCYESYDPDIYINENASVYETALEKRDGLDQTRLAFGGEQVGDDDQAHAKFTKLQKWLMNTGAAFRSGERNVFIYKLAGACCRFGIDQADCLALITREYLTKDGEFTLRETETAIKSAYRSPGNPFGSAKFDKNTPVNISTSQPVTAEDLQEPEKPKDIVFGMDVVEEALKLYDKGYETATTTYIPQLDPHFKLKRGELTLLSGIGNYGKSSFLEQILLISALKDNTKWGFFSPESFPAHEFYHNLTETALGADCTPSNPARPTREKYAEMYQKMSESFFFVYPSKKSHTPDYIRERFLELVIKEKVDGCIIDPFNKLANEWGDRDDKYLEKFLSDIIMWSRNTNVYSFIIAHPKQMRKDESGNYPCPDVFDLANGAMWNNMVDNILIYHRANYQTAPAQPHCELHIKKIRRQKIVGIPGMIEFTYNRHSRRFYFDGYSPLDPDSKIQSPAPKLVAKKEKKKEEEFEFPLE